MPPICARRRRLPLPKLRCRSDAELLAQLGELPASRAALPVPQRSSGAASASTLLSAAGPSRRRSSHRSFSASTTLASGFRARSPHGPEMPAPISTWSPGVCAASWSTSGLRGCRSNWARCGGWPSLPIPTSRSKRGFARVTDRSGQDSDSCRGRARGARAAAPFRRRCGRRDGGRGRRRTAAG